MSLCGMRVSTSGVSSNWSPELRRKNSVSKCLRKIGGEESALSSLE